MLSADGASIDYIVASCLNHARHKHNGAILNLAGALPSWVGAGPVRSRPNNFLFYQCGQRCAVVCPPKKFHKRLQRRLCGRLQNER